MNYNYKKIIILTLFLSLLLIGSVSAADVSNDTQKDINPIDENSADILKTENLDESQNEMNSLNEIEINTELTTTNTHETLTASEINVNNYTQLYDQIEILKNEGTSESYIINLNPKGDFAITDAIILQGNNSPAKDFTINGNGAVIDGKNSKYFLTIFENYKVTLNDLNFVDNVITEDGGGAIAAHTGSELNINNCNFTGCKAANETESIHAGAIRMGFDAILHLNNSIFNKNSATYGAGAIVIGGTLTEYNTRPHPDLDPTTITPTAFINNCQFIDNTAGHGGAINIEEYCSAIIVNCTFNGNSATDSELGLGGAICSDIKTYTVLINSTFKDNTAKQLGGAICGDSTSCLLSVNNTFENNFAEKSGGAIYTAPKSKIKIENTTFIKNEATFGSAVCTRGLSTLTVDDSLFSENKATDLGGAICTGEHNTLSINRTAFDKNQGKLGGAICLGNNSNMNIGTTTFTQNSAENGGAIYGTKNNNIIIKNTKLTNNIATSNGGAIVPGENTFITATNTTFTQNKANLGGAMLGSINSEIIVDDTAFTQNSAEKGGAIYTDKNNNIQIKNTEITDNTATTTGGAIIIGENNIITLNNVKLNKNQGKLGGAICLSANSDMNVDEAEFTQNSAENGGAIYGTKNNNIIIKNIKLTNNTATSNGGAVIIGENTVITAENTTFTQNKAKLGGAILSGINSEITMDDTLFTQNNAENGGAIYTAKNNNIQLKNTEMTNNTATTIGGAIILGESNTLTATKTVFTANKANVGGAILSGINSKITAESTSFIQNTANSNGGAIITKENNTITTTNTTFNANKANLGGAIFSDINSKITAESTSFIQNTANSNGGAIITKENNTITAINTAFTANKANLGGAICLSGNSKITADKTRFTQNNATKSGGIIYSTNNNYILMTNTEITNNVAVTTGGAIFTGLNTTLTASNTKFNKNTVGNLGGAICGESGSIITLANSEFNNNTANIGNAVYNPKQGTLVFKGSTFIAQEDYLSNGEVKVEDTLDTKMSIDSIDYSSEIVVEGKLVDEYNSPITGETVSVNIENENIRADTDENGRFIAKFENMNPGTYTITSTYPGNSVYNKSTASITKKVVDRQPSRISVADITTTYNTEQYLIINLVNNQNNPLSNMQITVDLGTGAEGYTTDNNGQIKIPTKDMSPKTYYANIKFNGSENYLPSNASAKITINKQTTQITSPDVTTTYNINKNFVVTLTDGQNRPLTNTPITIDFGIGGEAYTTNNNGQVTIPTNSLETDSYVVKIKYKGNENYEQSNTTAKITINKQTTQITSTNITTIYNKDGDIVVTLKNGQSPLSDETIVVIIKTRSVEMYTTDNNGQIKIPTKGLIPDIYDARILYYGSENYMPCNTTSKITVNKDATNITIDYANNELVFTLTDRQNTRLKELVLTTNYGKGDKAYRTDNNGQIKISTAGFAQDIDVVSARFDGTDKYLPSNTTKSMKNTKEATQITAPDITTTYNTNTNFVITLKNNQNNPISNAAISIDLGTGAKAYTTNSNGQVTISTKDLSPKTYDANIKYNGDDNYLPSTATAKITINNQTKQTTQITASSVTTTYNMNKDFVITLTNDQNSPITDVQITVNFGTGAKPYTTNSNGQVKISTATLVPKTYTVKIAFDGNDNYMESSSTAKVIVKKATPKFTAKAATFKKSVKTKKYTITLKNNKNQVMKKVKVTLKVKGKTYSATTNTKGKATFKITKLTKKGKYTATIKYNGNKYYNKLSKNIKITVK
ncbi:MAG: hypothetical protein U0L42_09355 [Methanobrevibacter sp.]|uniref:beta strand repeat-containing protein n=1 Tax=Methanobrevibacter sp. TaxID=66852 RepID=UPI002E7A7911|nr:right-handed parallel beta-helix repeat-containing protein [Methanobrevibacter sp.]MEE0935867.1 hypothetical protein [Methanobrevibacter sp.]